MSVEQQMFIELLRESLKTKNLEKLQFGHYDLNEVIRLSFSQELFPCIYNTLQDLLQVYGVEKHVGLTQMYYKGIAKNITQVEYARELFEGFSRAGVNYLPLKGITFRDVYPVAEERSMGDIDVLVTRESYDRAVVVLLDLGYAEQREEEESAHHVVFFNEHKGAIELHHALMDYRRHNADYSSFERSIWDRQINGTVCTMPCKLMGHVDTLVYMLMHMTAHFLVAGIGLKQVVDFGLYGTRYYDEIDWLEFGVLCHSYNLVGMADAVSYIANEYFGMTIPYIKNSGEALLVGEVLLEDMWISGNLGSDSIGSATGSIFLKDPHQDGTVSVLRSAGHLLRYFRLEVGKMFPRASRLVLLWPLLYIFFFVRRIGAKGGGGIGSIGYAVRSVQESRRRYILAKRMGLR